MFSASERCDSEADRFKREVGQLLARATSQKPVRTARPADWQDNIRNGLFREFRKVADEYVRLAIAVVRCAAMHQADLPVEFYFGEALRKVAEHAGLLAYLFVKLDEAPPEQGTLTKMDVIQALIWHIAKSVPDEQGRPQSAVPPILLPMLSTQFTYFHLNYVKQVGLIGIPLDALSRPYPDLPILWHEVGGYWVAQQRARELLQGRAKKLRIALNGDKHDWGTSWDVYRSVYEQSAIRSVGQSVEVVQDTDVSEGITAVLKLFSGRQPTRRLDKIDNDSGWQEAWLGEILADLFGIGALGHTMLMSLDYALKRAYETPDHADRKHPSPTLRLLVGRNFLDGEPLRPGNEQNGSENTESLAWNINGFVQEHYPGLAVKDPNTDAIAQLVTKLVGEALSTDKPSYKVIELGGAPAIQEAFAGCNREMADHRVQGSDLIWKLAGFTASELSKIVCEEIQSGDNAHNMSAASQEAKEKALERLERFRRIRFIEKDGVAPPEGQTLILPPSR